MILTIRGRNIRCYAKLGNKQHYQRMYEALSDERLDELHQESIDHEQANGKQTGIQITSDVGEMHRKAWLAQKAASSTDGTTGEGE